MDILFVFFLFALSLVVIIKGGDWFVDSAIWIAKVTGLPDVLIGATIVSIGTTLPELMVSITSSIQGHGDMSIGNAIGSTICNIGLILGICNIISPSKINSRMYSVKAITMFCYTLALFLFVIDGVISKTNTLLLILGLIIYIYMNYMEYNNSKKNNKSNRFVLISIKEILLNIAKFIIGVVFIIIGSKLLVNNGIIIAKFLNIPNVIISVTLIALGTSLPELTTSVSALIKKKQNLAVGNIIGSNILNITMVAGVSSMFSVITLNFKEIHMSFIFSLLLMIVLIVPSIFTKKISRLLGLTLLLIYISYIISIIMIK